jgi:hypothetical protein
VVADFRRALLAARNPDGGWSYYVGKSSSRLEPTAWALLALQTAGERMSIDPLVSWPRRNGWLVDRASDEVNIAFNAIAVVVLDALGAGTAVTAPLVEKLTRAGGQRLPQSPSNVQDNSLQGWSWVDGTFSWVEPTALGLLALKRCGGRRPDAQARVLEAERMLLDRVCVSGGWNYGNANVLGKTLEPYMATSALGLIALRNRHGDERVGRSLRHLIDHRLAERGAISLGLTRIALGLYDTPGDDVETALDAEWKRHAFMGGMLGTAIALYARAGLARGFEALRV